MTLNDLWTIMIIVGLFYALSTSKEERDADIKRRNKMKNLKP